jgi:hypothetical protein
MADGSSGWKSALWDRLSPIQKVIAIAAAVVLALGVSNALDNDDSPAQTEASEDCVTVPDDLVATLQEGFTTGTTTLRNAYAVKSNDLDNAWYIFGDLQGPGLHADEDIATWVKSGDLVVGGGLLIASNAAARNYSDWGAAAQPGSPAAEAASMDNHGAEESQDCVRDA